MWELGYTHSYPTYPFYRLVLGKSTLRQGYRLQLYVADDQSAAVWALIYIHVTRMAYIYQIMGGPQLQLSSLRAQLFMC